MSDLSAEGVVRRTEPTDPPAAADFTLNNVFAADHTSTGEFAAVSVPSSILPSAPPKRSSDFDADEADTIEKRDLKSKIKSWVASHSTQIASYTSSAVTGPSRRDIDDEPPEFTQDDSPLEARNLHSEFSLLLSKWSTITSVAATAPLNSESPIVTQDNKLIEARDLHSKIKSFLSKHSHGPTPTGPTTSPLPTLVPTSAGDAPDSATGAAPVGARDVREGRVTANENEEDVETRGLIDDGFDMEHIERSLHSRDTNSN